jgi:diguanylate cyclase (GGDEF)-like protein
MSGSAHTKGYRIAQKLLHDFLGVLQESQREHQGVDLNKLRFQCLSALSDLGGGAPAILMLAAGDDLMLEMASGDLPCKEEEVYLQLPAGDHTRLVISPEKLSFVESFRTMSKDVLKQENAFARALAAGGSVTGALIVLQPKEGARSKDEDLALAMIAAQAGTLLQAAEVVGAHIDLAMLDDLTGLYNRRYLTRRLVAEVSRATRHEHKLSLLNIVIDDFKKFVERNGREKTEKLIVEVAEQLKSRVGRPVAPFAFRISDVPVRYRGGEFFVILPETNKRGAKTKAERLRMFVANNPYDGGESLPRGKVTLSIGLATYPDDAMDAVSLLKQADKALRAAKQKGKNQVQEVPKG